MIFYMNLIFIVIAVSLDGFGVGMTYGMRNIRITITALLIIMCCSGFIVITSMTVGHLIRVIVSPTITSGLGSFILIGLGIFVLLSMSRPDPRGKKKRSTTISEKSPLYRLKSVINDPTKADDDRSGVISSSEATILGTALALDAFAAGLGASMLGYSPGLTAVLIALMSGLFLFSGMKLGHLLSKNKTLTRLTYLPPLLLISIGLYHFL